MSFQPADSISVIEFCLIFVAVLAAFWAGSVGAARRIGDDRGRVAVRVGGILVLWTLATGGVVASGALSGDPVPAMPMFFASILVGAVVFAFSRHGTRLARGLPLGALVAFHAFRLPLELVLHDWYGQGTIPETMTWTGQNWDIVTGVLAILVAPLASRSRPAVWAFNVIGFALLLNVIRVAVLSSPLPFGWGVEPPLVLIAHLPYAWIGPVCVAGAFAGHLILFRALLQRDAVTPRE